MLAVGHCTIVFENDPNNMLVYPTWMGSGLASTTAMVILIKFAGEWPKKDQNAHLAASIPSSKLNQFG